MSTKKRANQSIVLPCRLRREVTWETLLQPIVLLALIITGWSNLHSTLALMQPNLDRLTPTERKREAYGDTLPANVLNHICRLGQLEKPP